MMPHAALKAVPVLFVLSGAAFATEGAPVPRSAEAAAYGTSGGRTPGEPFPYPPSNMPIIVPDRSIEYSLRVIPPPNDRHYTLKIVPAPLMSEVARAARSK